MIVLFNTYYLIMNYEGKFLGIVSKSFKNDEGKDIIFHRIHVWSGSGADEFPISQIAVDQAMQDGVKFGDSVSLKLQGGKNKEGVTIYKIIEW